MGAASRSIRAVLAVLFKRMGDPERRDPLTTARRRQAMAAYFVAANLLGILQHRLWSDQSGFDNLFLAGDWTRNAISAGCVEAAVTSGMRAARGLSGHPASILGESDP